MILSLGSRPAITRPMCSFLLRADRATSPTTDFSSDSPSGSSLQILRRKHATNEGNTTKYSECTLLAKAQNKPLHFTTDRIIFAIGSVYTPRGLKLTHLRPQHTNPKRKRGGEFRPR